MNETSSFPFQFIDAKSPEFKEIIASAVSAAIEQVRASLKERNPWEWCDEKEAGVLLNRGKTVVRNLGDIGEISFSQEKRGGTRTYFRASLDAYLKRHRRVTIYEPQPKLKAVVR